jgi:hypothetical protein
MALALGPFISGAIAHYASWRISFYIIIPSSGLGIIVVFFSIGHLHKSNNAHLTKKEILKKIDWVGFGISVPMTVTLVLALQWGGTIYAWASWRIVLLLVLTAVLITVFLLWERRVGEGSMVPLKMLRQRSVALASIITFCDFSHLAVVAYYVSTLAGQVSAGTVLGTDLMIVTALLPGSPRRIYFRVWSHVRSLGRDARGRGSCWRALDHLVWLLQSRLDNWWDLCSRGGRITYHLGARHLNWKVDLLPDNLRHRYRTGIPATLSGSTDYTCRVRCPNGVGHAELRTAIRRHRHACDRSKRLSEQTLAQLVSSSRARCRCCGRWWRPRHHTVRSGPSSRAGVDGIQRSIERRVLHSSGTVMLGRCLYVWSRVEIDEEAEEG